MPSDLLSWYDANGRDLPWRRTREPYPVLVSEVMLQQTRVATALPYYERWMSVLPSVESLAAAAEDRVLALWQGLGYYRRAKSLHRAAAEIVARGWPSSRADWLGMPGVGQYTAAAMASLCLGEPTPVVDGNVERVYSRVSGDGSPRPRLTANARTWAERHISLDRPGDWNQAAMELGATVCTPRSPNCASCPLRGHCVAHRSGLQSLLPSRQPALAKERIERTISVPLRQGRFGVERVPPGPWWQGLWQFPTAPTGHETERDELLGEFRHTVTRHEIRYRVVLVGDSGTSNLVWATLDELSGYGMPAPHRKALAFALRRLGLPAPKGPSDRG